MNLEDDELSRPIALAGALGLLSWVGFQAKKTTVKLGDFLFTMGGVTRCFLVYIC